MYIDKKYLINLKGAPVNELALLPLKIGSTRDKRGCDKIFTYYDEDLLKKILPILIECDCSTTISEIKSNKKKDTFDFNLRTLKGNNYVKIKKNNDNQAVVTITSNDLTRVYKYSIIDGKIDLTISHFTYSLGDNTFTKFLDTGCDSFVITHGKERFDINAFKNDHNTPLNEEELRDTVLTSSRALTLNDIYSMLNKDDMLLYNYDNIFMRRTRKNEHGDKTVLEKLLISDKNLKALRLIIDGTLVDVRAKEGRYSVSCDRLVDPIESAFISDKLVNSGVFKSITKTLKK